MDHGRELERHPLVPLDQHVRQQLVETGVNSRCSQESTLMQIESGVKYDETPGRSTTTRCTQPVPWLMSVDPRE